MIVVLILVVLITTYTMWRFEQARKRAAARAAVAQAFRDLARNMDTFKLSLETNFVPATRRASDAVDAFAYALQGLSKTRAALYTSPPDHPGKPSAGYTRSPQAVPSDQA